MQTPLFSGRCGCGEVSGGCSRTPRASAPWDGYTFAALRGADEEFLLGAPIANLVLLARPADEPARPRRSPPISARVSHMGRISRGRC
jgi:hypothetical protein